MRIASEKFAPLRHREVCRERQTEESRNKTFDFQIRYAAAFTACTYKRNFEYRNQ